MYSENLRFSSDPAHPAREEKIVINVDIYNDGLAEGTEFQVAFYEEGQTLIGVIQTISLNPGIQPIRNAILPAQARNGCGV